MTEASTETALAPQQQAKPPAKAALRADGGGVLAIVPRSLEEAMRYANGLAMSEIVPDCFRYDGKKGNDVNVNLVAMGVLKVLEIGLSPQSGLAFLLPLNGRFTVWGDGAWALLQRGGNLAGHKVEWHWPEGFDKYTVPLDKWPNEIGCTVSLFRKGQEGAYINEYTVGRSRRAGLWNNSYKKPWIQDPERMLFNRARAYSMRDGFSDALFGLGIAEEVMDYAPAPKSATVDNSALDDDLPPMLPPPNPADDVEGVAGAYIAGLALVGSLGDLVEYQSQQGHQQLTAHLQRHNEPLYNRVIAANAKRYSEIEAGQRAEEEAAADAERNAASGEQKGLFG